jgi:1-phosphofructokinase
VDHENHTFTDINEPGPEVSESTLTAIDDYLKSEMKANDILVLAGSLPKGIPTDIYKHWCELGREVGAKVILDADGEVFEKGLEGIPFIIKPNQAELEMHFNETFSDEEKMIEKVQSIIDTGVYGVIISQGSEGCLMVTKEGVVKYNPLKVKVVSTVGAGDSMVAAIAYGLDEVFSDNEVLNIENMMDILRLGVAASSASIEQEGTHMGELRRVNELYQEVVIAHKTIY